MTRSAASAASALRLALGEADRSRVVGVEHEYQVRRDGALVDARELIDHLPGLGPHLDPGDPHARRNEWGGITTADGAEAEIATPPVVLRPGFTASVLDLAARGEALLAAGLGVRCTLEGYSTHISVAVPDDQVVAVALRVARRFAPALGLLLDHEGSPGLLVRPRHGRLEVCSDFVPPERLQVGLVATVGFVLAAESGGAMPPAVRVRLEKARQRSGWYVDRAAYGTDLYAGRGDAELRRRWGGTMRAHDVLQQSWAAARPHLVGVASADELSAVEAFLTGGLP